MKKNIIKLMLIAGFLFTGLILTAQIPPPPPGGGHDLGGNQPNDGGGAPIDNGLGILLTLGAVYGGKKVYYMMRPKQVPEV
ncbi:MAG: hypothetical protein HOO86_07030 [Bacteroidales bacterium]|nr:hypothetical protein [Bacteroidales bacterium]